jgi:hypothetical protein
MTAPAGTKMDSAAGSWIDAMRMNGPTDGVAIPRMQTRPTDSIFDIRGFAAPSVG